MKKAWTIMGILLLLIGLVSITVSSVLDKKTNLQEVSDAPNQWTISGSFQEGENLSLYFVPHAKWSLPPYDYETGRKFFTVNITNDAANSYTLIEVTLTPPASVGGIPTKPYAYALVIFSINVTHHGAITIDDSPTKINGVVKNDGLYLVNCSLDPPVVSGEDLKPSPAPPPIALVLYSITVETKHPYNFLLPVGTSLSIVGLVVSIWGVKSKEQRTSRRKVQR